MSYNGSGMDYPIKKGVPSEGKINKVGPEENGKKKNPAMETSLFNIDRKSVV